MARAIVTGKVERRAIFEPLYDIDPHTGATIEIFYADCVLAASFGRRAGWHWWSCLPGCLPHTVPRGPFATSYGAFRDALSARDSIQFGRRITTFSTKP
jgi:hypothetical protein